MNPFHASGGGDRVGGTLFARQVGGVRAAAAAAGTHESGVAPPASERVARVIVERGFTKSYDYALQTMKEAPYSRWRQYRIEDTVRFYALRLHEAGVIRTSPKKIIADGTNWRFFDELKKELKG